MSPYLWPPEVGVVPPDPGFRPSRLARWPSRASNKLLGAWSNKVSVTHFMIDNVLFRNINTQKNLCKDEIKQNVLPSPNQEYQPFLSLHSTKQNKINKSWERNQNKTFQHVEMSHFGFCLLLQGLEFQTCQFQTSECVKTNYGHYKFHKLSLKEQLIYLSYFQKFCNSVHANEKLFVQI